MQVELINTMWLDVIL